MQTAARGYCVLTGGGPASARGSRTPPPPTTTTTTTAAVAVAVAATAWFRPQSEGSRPPRRLTVVHGALATDARLYRRGRRREAFFYPYDARDVVRGDGRFSGGGPYTRATPRRPRTRVATRSAHAHAHGLLVYTRTTGKRVFPPRTSLYRRSVFCFSIFYFFIRFVFSLSFFRNTLCRSAAHTHSSRPARVSFATNATRCRGHFLFTKCRAR